MTMTTKGNVFPDNSDDKIAVVQPADAFGVTSGTHTQTPATLVQPDAPNVLGTFTGSEANENTK